MSEESSTNPKSKWQKFAEEQSNQEAAASESAVVGQNESPEATGVEEEETKVHDGSALHIEDAEHVAGGASELLNKVQALELKITGFKDQAARAMAEVENMRRRAEKDVSNAHRYGNEKLMAELLPIIDSMVRAQEGVDDSNPVVKSMLEGVAMTLELLEKTLEKFGLTVIAPEKGEAFNPECHEAMSMLPDPDLEKNAVIQVLQKGYELNGRVLRAAMVIVSQ